MRRICVVGNSGSGKTHLARRLAQRLDLPHVELDALNHRAGWLFEPDTYVWLDYPRRVVLPRIVRRTLGRALLRRELWNGNRERWRNLLERDPEQHIILWSWTQHGSYRAWCEELMTLPGQASWIRLRRPHETDRWLSQVRPQGRATEA